jgi:hypothetical protein
MKKNLFTITLINLLLLQSISIHAQSPDKEILGNDEPVLIQKLSGPRIGVTVLDQSSVQAFKDFTDDEIFPVISQFGWQFETRFASTGNFTGIVEFVPLIGGLEQHKFLPSFNLLVGGRFASGWEFAIGPNASIGNAGLIFAGGYNFKSGAVNLPLNFAVLPTEDGARFSLLLGFNIRTESRLAN